MSDFPMCTCNHDQSSHDTEDDRACDLNDCDCVMFTVAEVGENKMTDIQVIEHLTATNKRLQDENYKLSNKLFAIETQLKSKDSSIDRYRDLAAEYMEKMEAEKAKRVIMQEAIESEKNKT